MRPSIFLSVDNRLQRSKPSRKNCRPCYLAWLSAIAKELTERIVIRVGGCAIAGEIRRTSAILGMLVRLDTSRRVVIDTEHEFN